jgi:hypothetical protein
MTIGKCRFTIDALVDLRLVVFRRTFESQM